MKLKQVKTKVINRDEYKSQHHYNDAVDQWEEKGWRFTIETMSTGKHNFCYTVMVKEEFEGQER